MKFLFLTLFFAACLFVARPADAHQLDLAYLDFGVSTSTHALTLTVAMHSHQVFELVRSNAKAVYALKPLQDHADEISAYVQDHIVLRRGEAVCDWDAGPAVTPNSEFQALVDGITVAGPVTCAGTEPLTVETSLFLEKFPTQQVSVRLESPNGYVDQFILDRTARTGQVDVEPLFPKTTSTEAMPVPPPPSSVPYAILAGVLTVAALSFIRLTSHRRKNKNDSHS